MRDVRGRMSLAPRGFASSSSVAFEASAEGASTAIKTPRARKKRRSRRDRPHFQAIRNPIETHKKPHFLRGWKHIFNWKKRSSPFRRKVCFSLFKCIFRLESSKSTGVLTIFFIINWIQIAYKWPTIACHWKLRYSMWTHAIAAMPWQIVFYLPSMWLALRFFI